MGDAPAGTNARAERHLCVRIAFLIAYHLERVTPI
jgi:hypothetical protein